MARKVKIAISNRNKPLKKMSPRKLAKVRARQKKMQRQKVRLRKALIKEKKISKKRGKKGRPRDVIRKIGADDGVAYFMVKGIFRRASGYVRLDENMKVTKRDDFSYYQHWGHKYNMVNCYKKTVQGACGSRKIYMSFGNGKGLLIMLKCGRKKFSLYHDVYTKLYEHSLYPKFSPCKIITNILVFAGKGGRKRDRFRGTYWGLYVREIDAPYLFFEASPGEILSNEEEIFRVLGKKFRTDNRYRAEAIDVLRQNEIERDPSFVQNHPLFTREYFIQFCKEMEDKFYRWGFGHMFGKTGQLELRWGNVLYCKRDKAWYMIDFD